MSNKAPHQRIAKIKRAFLGIEDHGIATVMLDVDYGGSGQGVGGYTLDEYDGKRRIGTVYGMEFILSVIRACGVQSWDAVPGRTILVYTADDGWNAKVIGIGPLPTEPGVLFMFDSLLRLAKGT